MQSIREILKRKRELKLNRTDMLKVQSSLSDYLSQPVRLKPALGKAGQDQIYSARLGFKTVAMVRIQNRNKLLPEGGKKWNFRVRLGLRERIDREWKAYEKLSSIGLSPKPLWRNDIAIACTWVYAKRAARLFVYANKGFWPLAETTFAAVQEMHNLGITHMDLNLGNILINRKSQTLSFIDFEFGPENWLTEGQQRACDYFILLNEFCRKRRGGKVMLADPARMAGLLDKYLRNEDRNAHLGSILMQFERLSQNEGLCKYLSDIFPNLET